MVVLLLLLLALLGCTPTPQVEAVKPATHSVGVGDRHVSFQLPGDWTLGDGGWGKAREGRIRAIDAGPDPHRVSADLLETALREQDPEKICLQLSHFPPVSFEYEPDRDAAVGIFRQVDQGCAELRRGKLDSGRKRLRESLKALRAMQLEDGLEARIRHYFTVQSRRGEEKAINSITPLQGTDHPAAVVAYRTRYGGSSGLFVLYGEHLLVFLMSSPLTREQEGQKLRELAATLRFDVPASEVPAVPAVAVTTRPAPTKAPAPRRQAPEWVGWLAPFVPLAVLLLFTAVPAWIGATMGCSVARLSGEDPRPHAATTAFWMTGAGVFLGVVLASVVIVMWAASAPSGSGVMTPAAAGGLAIVLLALFGTMAGLVGGALAAAGAWLGASSGPRTSALLAALLAVGGAVIGPFLLGLMPVKKKKRYRSL
ncbi:MAG: hypothetical protein AB1758_28525, partial [Candidatus Eremiobacterota bacterium]